MPYPLTPQEAAYQSQFPDDNISGNYVAASVVAIIIPTFAIALRLVARWRGRLKLVADDWLIITGWIAIMGRVSVGLATIPYGMGRHMVFVTDIPMFIKLWISSVILYCIGSTLVKLSILSFYNRLFRSKNLFYTSVVVGALVVIYNLGNVFVDVFTCNPPSKQWEDVPGSCISPSTAYLVLAIANLVTDVFILLMPVPQVWKLQMSFWRKMQVLGIFALGSLVCIFGVLRTATVSDAAGGDLSWDSVYSALWSMTEVQIGLFCACIPTFLPLIRRRGRRNTGAFPAELDGYPAYPGSRSYPRPISNSLGSRTVWVNVRAEKDKDQGDDVIPFRQYGVREGSGNSSDGGVETEEHTGTGGGAGEIHVMRRIEQSFYTADSTEAREGEP